MSMAPAEELLDEVEVVVEEKVMVAPVAESHAAEEEKEFDDASIESAPVHASETGDSNTMDAETRIEHAEEIPAINAEGSDNEA